MNQKRIDQLHRITRSDSEIIENKSDNIKRVATRMGATALVLFAVVGGIYASQSDARSPQFSNETHEYKVEKYDTVWGASKTVDGAESVGTAKIVDYVEEMPENQVTLSDGLLQENETLILPNHVER